MARLAVLLAAVCFGTTGTAQALGPDGLEPAAVGAARIAVGGLLLVLGARALAGRAPRGGSGDRGVPSLAVPAAALGVAVYQLAFFAAVDRTGVVVGTLVAIGSGPALAGLLDRAARGTPLTARWAGATALAAAGVGLLALASGAEATVDPLGVALAVLAGAAYATYTVAAKALLDAGRAPEAVMALAFGLGALLLLPVLVLVGAGWLLTPGGAALALYLGVVPTAVAYVLFARGLRRLPAAETATLTLAEPLTAAVLGAVVLGERLGPLAGAGALLVLAGLLVLALVGPRRGAVAFGAARGARSRDPPSTRSRRRCGGGSSTASSRRGRGCPSASSRSATPSPDTPCARPCARWPPTASCASSPIAARPWRGSRPRRYWRSTSCARHSSSRRPTSPWSATTGGCPRPCASRSPPCGRPASAPSPPGAPWPRRTGRSTERS